MHHESRLIHAQCLPVCPHPKSGAASDLGAGARSRTDAARIRRGRRGGQHTRREEMAGSGIAAGLRRRPLRQRPDDRRLDRQPGNHGAFPRGRRERELHEPLRRKRPAVGRLARTPRRRALAARTRRRSKPHGQAMECAALRRLRRPWRDCADADRAGCGHQCAHAERLDRADDDRPRRPGGGGAHADGGRRRSQNRKRVGRECPDLGDAPQAFPHCKNGCQPGGIRQGREGAAGNLRAGRQIRRRAAGD